ncbi:MAG: hypothetical protein KDG52_08265 [Rhodocyclaceae bacterium]|nr:hypothetical protein [Rhodocyclaceae bacterium]
MESYGLLLLALIVAAVHLLGVRRQRQRVALLSEYLRPYRIEALMAELVDGYLRALGASDADRSEPIWAMLAERERQLTEQLQALSLDLADASAETMRIGRADLRKLIAIHARGISRVVENDAALERRDRAYMLCAEIFLLQHSCHWYCRSRSVASARLLSRHRTTYAQVLGAVSASTREAYLALTDR